MHPGAFPAFLSDFDPAALEADRSTLVAIGRDGTIAWTNAAWTRFARENGGAGVADRFGVGSSYFDGISPELRGFYQRVIDDALRSGTPFEQDYECSSPDVYRRFHLRVLPVDAAGLLLSHRAIAERPHTRTAVEPLESRYRNDHGQIVQCSNCRCVRRADGSAWDWIPGWVKSSPQGTSHGICPVCVGYYYGDSRFRTA